MQQDLTKGSITKTMLFFAVPMILGNLLQQFYNIADTLIVGRVLGAEALAAVGSAYSLMTFLTSILLGLSMGSGTVFSICFGQKNMDKLKSSIFLSFFFIASIAIVLNLLVFLLIDPILHLLQTPDNIYTMMREYLLVIFFGITATFLYNYFASLLRAIGNSIVPLVFLAISALLNVGLDLLLVLVFPFGVKGAAIATVLAQFVSGIGILCYTFFHFSYLRPEKRHCKWNGGILKEITQFSFLTCLQQSVMNFGILMVQGLVNSFGATVMAAFTVAVKIDSFAYMPVQDFGNAFSTFIAQNYGANQFLRIKKGIRNAIITSTIFCVIISAIVFLFAKPLMMIFVKPEETEIISIGVQYLRTEGTFYCGIGCLFLLYGFYRAIQKPGMSVILTIISLGTRVLLAYMLSSIPTIGTFGIWISVPIGWFLADLVGLLYYFFSPSAKQKLQL